MHETLRSAQLENQRGANFDPSSGAADADREAFFAALPFCKPLSDEKFAYLAKNADYEFENQTQILLQSGARSEGILVVIRGVVALESNGWVKFEESTGASIGVFEFLSNRPYSLNCVARTAVEYFFLSRKDLEFALSGRGQSAATEALWKMAGVEVVLTRFAEHFGALNRDELERMVRAAKFVQTAKTAEIRVRHKAIVMDEMNDDSAAPRIIDAGQHIFKQNTILLILVPNKFTARAQSSTESSGKESTDSRPSNASAVEERCSLMKEQRTRDRKRSAGRV